MDKQAPIQLLHQELPSQTWLRICRRKTVCHQVRKVASSHRTLTIRWVLRSIRWLVAKCKTQVTGLNPGYTPRKCPRIPTPIRSNRCSIKMYMAILQWVHPSNRLVQRSFEVFSRSQSQSKKSDSLNRCTRSVSDPKIRPQLRLLGISITDMKVGGRATQTQKAKETTRSDDMVSGPASALEDFSWRKHPIDSLMTYLYHDNLSQHRKTCLFTNSNFW